MARFPRVTTREQVSPEHQQHYDYIAGSRGHVVGPFTVLLNSPDVAQRIAHVGTYIRFENTLPGNLRELAILTVAREWNCQFEWTAHQPIGEGEGLSAETIAAVRDRTAPDGLSGDEELVFRYVSSLLEKGRVPDDVFQQAQERFGTRTVTDLTATAGYYSMLACVLNAGAVTPDAGTPHLLPDAEY